jgi:hypothetical protein
MKNLFTKTLFHLLSISLLITVAPLISISQIVSAPGGGLWNSVTTWVGGIVPGAADNVAIVSTVSVNGNACNNITIESGGILQNHPVNSYTLTVNGNLTNNGSIINNVYNFNLNVHGNVSNNGVMSNNALTLSGSGNQQLASTQPISLANFTKNNTAGRALATTNLNFSGTTIALNSDTLEFTTGNLISMNGGYLSSGVLYKSSLPALQITGGNQAYVYVVTIDAPQAELFGDLRIYGNSNVFKNNITNFGTLQNNQNNAYTLTIAGNFTNNGTVQNNVYNFTINVSGNLTNNGTWTNQTTTLNGSGNQGISMSQPFQGSNLARTASTGRVQATSALSFIGTAITLNSDTLEFTSGSSISMSGGSLNSGVIYKSALPALQITAGNGTYAYTFTIDAHQSEFYGDLLFYGSSNVLKNNITNFGTLQNNQNNNYTLTIAGNFTNNGTVQNNVYNFTINVSGNLTNNGNWGKSFNRPQRYHESGIGYDTAF